jgi:orotidine-5'-phosphate decarboxylase
MGSFGAVVGATISATDERLDIGGPLLVPGVGAQGGTAESVRRIFGPALRSVLPSSSREILAAGPRAADVRAAAERTNQQFAALLA